MRRFLTILRTSLGYGESFPLAKREVLEVGTRPSFFSAPEMLQNACAMRCGL
jgi:hypothetical protein